MISLIGGILNQLTPRLQVLNSAVNFQISVYSFFSMPVNEQSLIATRPLTRRSGEMQANWRRPRKLDDLIPLAPFSSPGEGGT